MNSCGQYHWLVVEALFALQHLASSHMSWSYSRYWNIWWTHLWFWMFLCDSFGGYAVILLNTLWSVLCMSGEAWHPLDIPALNWTLQPRELVPRCELDRHTFDCSSGLLTLFLGHPKSDQVSRQQAWPQLPKEKEIPKQVTVGNCGSSCVLLANWQNTVISEIWASADSFPQMEIYLKWGVW